MNRFVPISRAFLGLALLFPAFSQGQQAIPQVQLTAESAMAVRLDQRILTLSKNIDERRPVASTQKLLTALIVAESGGLDEKVAVKRTDGQIEPRNLWITEGSSYPRGTLLEMMLIRSFNDVTKCLARDHAGSQGEFTAVMNQRAAELGMENSVFKNAHGLTAEGQFSTARDMMKLAVVAFSQPDIRRIVRIKETTFTYSGAKTIPVANSNELLLRYPSCVGMKTGFTKAAGRCLVAAAEENGKTVIAVILGSTMEEVWNDAEKVIRFSLQY